MGPPLAVQVSEDFDIITINGAFIALFILISCFSRHKGFAATSVTHCHRLCTSTFICLYQSTITIGNLSASDLINLHLSGGQLGHAFDFMAGLFGLPRLVQLLYCIIFGKLMRLQRHCRLAITGPQFLQCPRLGSTKGGIGSCIG